MIRAIEYAVALGLQERLQERFPTLHLKIEEYTHYVYVGNDQIRFTLGYHTLSDTITIYYNSVYCCRYTIDTEAELEELFQLALRLAREGLDE